MTEIFRVPNFPDINLKDVTALTADAASGQKVINVIGDQGFANNDIGLLGALGSLVGELATVNTTTPSSITMIANLINNHRKTEPFTKLFGDNIRMYRAPNVNNYPPDDTIFAANLQSTTPLDFDASVSYIPDATGGSDFWYKFTYYNSISHAETSLAFSVPIRGGGFGHYCSVEDIRREAGLLTNNQVQDTQIATRRDQAESEIKGALLASDYTLPLTDNNGNLFVPAVIENITRLLAAGYVLTQDYGPIANGDSKDGDTKIKQALGILTEVQNHTIILADIDEKQMATNLRIKGTPDDTTATSGNDVQRSNPPEPPMFTISRVF